jgi:predicted methyltransferase
MLREASWVRDDLYSKIPIGKEWMTCPVCTGIRFIDRKNNVECTNCNGRGQVLIQIYFFDSLPAFGQGQKQRPLKFRNLEPADTNAERRSNPVEPA